MSLTSDPFLPVQRTRQISGTMGKFEDLFQDLDVHTEVMDSTMSAATTLNTPEDQVTGLMREVRVIPTAREAVRQGGTVAACLHMFGYLLSSIILLSPPLRMVNRLPSRMGWR